MLLLLIALKAGLLVLHIERMVFILCDLAYERTDEGWRSHLVINSVSI